MAHRSSSSAQPTPVVMPKTTPASTPQMRTDELTGVGVRTDGRRAGLRRLRAGVLAPALAAAVAAVALVGGAGAAAAAGDRPVKRIGGADRVDTAIAASQQAFAAGAAGGAVIARADGFADALAGSVLAARTGPMLLNWGSAMDPRVRAEVARAVKPGATVYLLGTADVVSDQVAAAMKADGHPVVRLGGQDRYETAALIAAQVAPKGNQYGSCSYTFVTGRDFADGLSAATLGNPLLLTDGKTMPEASAAEVRRCVKATGKKQEQFNGRGVGGPGAEAFRAWAAQEAGAGYTSSPDIVGFDRYETSAKVLETYAGNGEEPPLAVAVATGTNYPDALVASGTLSWARGQISGTRGGPIPVVLTRPDRLPDWVAKAVSNESISVSGFFVMGSSEVVSDAVASQLRTIRSGT